VFERYSAHVRRAVFWGGSVARLLRAEQIGTEHLLLGLLHGAQRGSSAISESTEAAIRLRVEHSTPALRESSPAQDSPALSEECKFALQLGAKEADALEHTTVEISHLILALLRIENCAAAKLLREFGVDYDQYRATLRHSPPEEPRSFQVAERPIERVAPWSEAPPRLPAAPVLETSIRALENLLDNTVSHLHAYSVSYGDQRLKRKPWTRKEAVGHLIDWAMAHQRWFACALAQSKVTAAAYPGEGEVAIQHYADFSWWETVDLWLLLNWLLLHVLRRIPEDKLEVRCRIGIADPISLAGLIRGYVGHCEDIIGQILARL
jgi:hypothetical protein